MLKTTVRLDAICAKLKQGLNQSDSVENDPPSESSSVEESSDGAVPPYVSLSHSETEKSGQRENHTNDESNNDTNLALDSGDICTLNKQNGAGDDADSASIPSSRASTPTQCNNTVPVSLKTLSGASKRKAKKRIRLEPDQSFYDPSSSNTETGSVSFSNSKTDEYSTSSSKTDECSTSNSKASNSIGVSTQEDFVNLSMHCSDTPRKGNAQNNTYGDKPQDLSVKRKPFLIGTDTEYFHSSSKPVVQARPRPKPDSYDREAILNFAESSEGQDSADLLIDEDEGKEKAAKKSKVVETPSPEEVYPSEPEDLSMPKPQSSSSDHSPEPQDLSGIQTPGLDDLEEHNMLRMPNSSELQTNSPPVSTETVPSNHYEGSKPDIIVDSAAVHEYAARTMKEFLGIFGYDDEERIVREGAHMDNMNFKHLVHPEHKQAQKKMEFLKVNHHGQRRSPSPRLNSHSMHDELQPQFMHMKLQRKPGRGKRKPGLRNGSQTFVQKMKIHVNDPTLHEDFKRSKWSPNQTDREGSPNPNSPEDREKIGRFSKYDYFIQKLEAGESISNDIPNIRISKYDSYIRKLQEGNIIDGVIGKRESESQKICDMINSQIRLKQEGFDGDVAMTTLTGDKPSISMTSPALPQSAYTMINPFANIPHMPSLSLPPGEALNLSNHPEKGRDTSPDSETSRTDSQSGLFKKSLLSDGEEQDLKSVGSQKSFGKYIVRYAANENCQHCGFHYKEHFHCLEDECNFARFTRKEDVMRHYNWHRRRDDSLQHGFMRFSPSDDCSQYYPGCALNFRNTHYHCMQPGCSKVYTSTSDVLGHENFHKKNTTLLNEGFQRYRATEDCGKTACEFYGQKTTHFHCRRPSCDFVFKNKYDIERHKTFHAKDDIYRREGFKKFSKHESCRYEGCPYSHMLNHFHCLRPGCNFVFTTANQMHSHKRKHERLERIIRYDHTSLAPGNKPGISPSHPLPPTCLPPNGNSATSLVKSEPSILQNVLQSPMVVLKPGIPYTALSLGGPIPMLAHMPLPLTTTASMAVPQCFYLGPSSPPDNAKPPPPPYKSRSYSPGKDRDSPPFGDRDIPPYKERKTPPYKEKEAPPYREKEARSESPGSSSEEKLPEGFAKIEAAVGSREGDELNDSLNLPVPSEISPPADAEESDDEGASKDKTEDKPEGEVWQKFLKRYTANDPCNPRCDLLYKDHYHCVTEGCGQVFKSKEGVKKHTKYHHMSQEATKLGFKFYPHGQSCEDTFKGCAFSPLAHYHCMWSLNEGSFCGEVVHTGSSLMKPHFEKHHKNPEKERIIERCETELTLSPPIPTSVIHSPSPPMVATVKPHTISSPVESPEEGYAFFEPDKCFDDSCPLRKQNHYHCTRAECQYATETMDMILDHKTNEKLIFDSFKQCSRKMDCRRPGCKYNLLHKHFHCMHQGCHFSFLQVQQMESHGRKHMRRIYGKLFNRPNNNSPGSSQQFVLPMMSFPRSESPPTNPLLATSPYYHSLMSRTLFQGLSLSPAVVSTVAALSAIPSPTFNATGITPHTSMQNHHHLMVPTTSFSGFTYHKNSLSPSNPFSRYGEATSPTRDASPGRYSPRKRPLTLVIEDPGAPSGYKRYKRGPLDSSMQEKFHRYERSDHCGDNTCQYAMNTTHYHCLHNGCNYRFAGKTMMYKHAQHHERVDGIIQDDFQRFKSTVNCLRSDCEFGSKSTHFHCLRCPFICTDSGKVALHRKQHTKSLVAERHGFKQFNTSDVCPFEDCKYGQKYVHFHCIREGCDQAMMGTSQMELHSREYHNESM